MKSYPFTGLVIKRHNWGDSGKIITVFTKDQGKIQLKVSGVRKLISKRASSIELFNLIHGQAVKGRGFLDVLTEVSIVTSYPVFKKHLGRINIAYQICEVIDKITPDNEPHLDLYNLIIDHISQISNLNSDWKTTLNQWLLDYLITLGYWPKNQVFSGQIISLIESIAQKPLHAHKVLDRLR